MSRTLAVERNLGELKKEAIVLLRHLRQEDVKATKEFCLLDPEAGTLHTCQTLSL